MDRFQRWLSGTGWFHPKKRHGGRQRDAAEVQATVEKEVSV